MAMSLMNLEIKDLRLVGMIAATGNLTKAASLLNISQPALSRQLSDLEERVGAKIFVRQPKSMTPTVIGQDILALADDILDRVEKTEKEITARLEGGSGELTLAIECMPIFACLPAVLKIHQQLFPNVKVNTIGTVDFDVDLRQTHSDLAVTMRCSEKKGIVFERLFEDEIVVIAATDNLIAMDGSISLSDFAAADYCSIVSKANDPFYAVLQKAGIEPLSVTVIGEVNTLMNIVSASATLAVMPFFAARAMLADGRLKACRIKDHPLKATWYMAHLQDHPLPAYAKGLIKIIREFMG